MQILISVNIISSGIHLIKKWNNLILLWLYESNAFILIRNKFYRSKSAVINAEIQNLTHISINSNKPKNKINVKRQAIKPEKDFQHSAHSDKLMKSIRYTWYQIGVQANLMSARRYSKIWIQLMKTISMSSWTVKRNLMIHMSYLIRIWATSI